MASEKNSEEKVGASNAPDEKCASTANGKKLQFEWDDSGDEVVLGIDEAGRGPVLGPMVYACAFCKKKDLVQLKKLGVDDSKQLTEEQRESLRKKLDNATFVQSLSRILQAEEISENMLRRIKVNLNVISHDAALDLVQQAFDHNVPVTEVYVDTVGTAETYAEKFRANFPQLRKVVVEKKADAKFQIVGAASIVAKTTRDRIIRTWVFPELERARQLPNFIVDANDNTNEEGTNDDGEDDEDMKDIGKDVDEDDEDDEDDDYGLKDGVDDVQKNKIRLNLSKPKGSGYPSDPNTKAWMDANCDPVFGFPTFVRFSWGTTKTLLEKKAVQVDWYVKFIFNCFSNSWF